MTSSLVRFSGLSYCYGKNSLERQVLRDLDGRAAAGELVALTGPSGSGKTTLLTLIGGLRRVQTGSVKIAEQELSGANDWTLRKIRLQIGFIFQAHNLIGSLTARQNLLLKLRLYPQLLDADMEAVETLNQLGLGDHIDKYPHQLSGGQRQRVAIGRALVGRPKVILADEPTASLDGKSGQMVIQWLRAQAKQHDATILLVTHDNRIMDVADRILSLEDGRLVQMNQMRKTA